MMVPNRGKESDMLKFLPEITICISRSYPGPFDLAMHMEWHMPFLCEWCCNCLHVKVHLPPLSCCTPR
eukprot:1527905-Amphidinium_carterae.2